ncbi:hypothetical protein E5720_17670 [Rhodococcus sp. PAMC28707]|uniref:hypothetical protein n=1 Tax=unclassified Rhodococcus (in: high G+C Gram-positive bacteria) TaxID=192944 RepID=UPI00109E09F7|nr:MULTISPECIES: hypothetical protein [unclassified Rhodococcus (in: high G+C Gram-positive bacteria)]QCB51789.1 hypothetical protein E5769_17855 [Rhodococcus sp. PAMC28705]QCB60043.1 hypothetical protein E5720_17670 [Rhodococcus sp. PAMC28707]
MNDESTDRPLPRNSTSDEQAANMQRWNERCLVIDQLRRDVGEALPNTSRFTQDIHLFMLVIVEHLGDTWVAANAEFHAEEKPGMGAKYLRRDSDPEILTLAQHYLRLRELARRLFAFADEEFYDRLCANVSRRDLEGAAFEADVVQLLLALPVLIDLREERNVKGDDYDIDVWLHIPNVKWSIEVKTKHDDGPYTQNGLLNTIRHARKQLPANGLGSIFFKVPQTWVNEPAYKAEAAGLFESFFRNTSRVHAVVVVWDIYTHDADNEKSWSWKSGRAVYRSPKIDPQLDELLGHYEKLWSQPYDFVDLIFPF